MTSKSKSWTQSDVDLGTLSISPYFNAKRRQKHDEIKEYERKYLARYKQPKSKQAKSSSVKHDTDVGTLSLGKYVNAKRKAKQNEIKEYEKQYLSRYKQPKSVTSKSKSWTQSDVDLGTLSISPYFNAKRRQKQDEIKEYERKYLARYKQPKSKQAKSSSVKHDTDVGTLSITPYFNAKRRQKHDEIKQYERTISCAIQTTKI